MTQFETAVPGDVVDTAVADIRAAAEIGSRLFYPQELTGLDRASTVSMAVRAGRIGPFVLGELSYSSTVRIDCGELATSYHVNIPLSGRIATSHRGQDAVATPDSAAVYGPEGRTVLSRWDAGARQLCVKIDRRAVESALSVRIGRELTRPVRLAPALDLRSGPGRSWSELARMMSEGLHAPGSMLHHPIAAVPLVESLLNGLLCAVRHEFSDALAGDAPRCASPVVAAAIDYLHDRAADPIAIADVAAHCSISVRALQEGFAQHVGRSPMQYLRQVRLRRAHDDLLAADPGSVTVSRVANRWGFGNAGRFATAHRAAFGEEPARTLRRLR